MSEPTTHLEEERSKELLEILESFFRGRWLDTADDHHNSQQRT
ncbi:MAG: hypothetical protein QXY59_05535 [Candidatus Korarchaeota archaeon]